MHQILEKIEDGDRTGKRFFNIFDNGLKVEASRQPYPELPYQPLLLVPCELSII
jgi:hypothetical protein